MSTADLHIHVACPMYDKICHCDGITIISCGFWLSSHIGMTVHISTDGTTTMLTRYIKDVRSYQNYKEFIIEGGWGNVPYDPFMTEMKTLARFGVAPGEPIIIAEIVPFDDV